MGPADIVAAAAVVVAAAVARLAEDTAVPSRQCLWKSETTELHQSPKG